MMRLSRKKSTASHIKDALDNLPAGLCFFDEAGMPVLCNTRMRQLTNALSGRDLQHLSELQRMLRGPAPGVDMLEKDTYRLPDGAVWRFEQTAIADGCGACYTQATAYDITELYQAQTQLRQDTERQKQIAQRLEALSANVIAFTREEETLKIKMRIHDEIGRGVIASRRMLSQDAAPEMDMSVWRSAVAILHAAGETDDLTSLRQAAAALGVTICLDGELPESAEQAALLLAAMRECVSNCARHAGGDTLRATVRETRGQYTAVFTNSGRLPQGAITEGGGLSSLRRRVERAGGMMRVEAVPTFALTISLPGKGDSL